MILTTVQRIETKTDSTTAIETMIITTENKTQIKGILITVELRTTMNTTTGIMTAATTTDISLMLVTNRGSRDITTRQNHPVVTEILNTLNMKETNQRKTSWRRLQTMTRSTIIMTAPVVTRLVMNLQMTSIPTCPSTLRTSGTQNRRTNPPNLVIFTTVNLNVFYSNIWK